MRVKEQYEIFLNGLTTRKRNPIKPATLAAYKSYYLNWIAPQLGKMDLSAVENGAMKALVAKMAAAGLSPSTIGGVTNCVKSIISSATDRNGNPLYPRTWNSIFIDAPVIDPKEQDTPIIGAGTVTEAITKAEGQYGRLFALLAGSGLRINEALALKVGPQPVSSYWDPEESKLVIRRALYHGREQATKTAAGVREVDLAPELNEYMLCDETPSFGWFLHTNKQGGPLRLRTVYDVAKKLGIPGFHSFRRFRITHLENQGVPRTLVQFWVGHSNNQNITDRYCKLNKEIEIRKEWAKKAGLGFTLPQVVGKILSVPTS